MAKPIKIIIVGNGFGGVYSLKSLHKLFHKKIGEHEIELTLIGEKNYFLFTPMLHEVATGGISPENIIEPIRKVFGCKLDKFFLGTVDRVDLESHTVEVDSVVLSYDYLILSPGSKTNFYHIPGAEEHTLTLKSLEDAIRLKNQVIRQMERASHTENLLERKKNLSFVIVGGGPTGVEIAAELQELIQESFAKYYPREMIDETSVTLIQNGPELIPQFSEKMRRKSLEFLHQKNIKVMLNTSVKEVTSSGVILNNDMRISSTNIIWVAGVTPINLNFEKEIPKSENGKIIVNEYLAIENHPEVFVIGDNSTFKDTGINKILPALAQVAEGEAKYVAKSIQNDLQGKKQKAFVYRHKGNLMSVGQWMAVGQIWRFIFWGPLAWLLWRIIYLCKLISFRKKVRVAFDWTVNVFTPRDISEF